MDDDASTDAPVSDGPPSLADALSDAVALAVLHFGDQHPEEGSDDHDFVAKVLDAVLHRNGFVLEERLGSLAAEFTQLAAKDSNGAVN